MEPVASYDWFLGASTLNDTPKPAESVAGHDCDLSLAQQRFEALLGCEPWMVLALRPDMSVEFCNEAYARFVGMKVQDLVGRNLLSLFPVLAQTRSLAAYRDVLRTGKPARVEGWLGKRCMLAHVHAAPWGLIALADDITAYKQAIEAAAAGPQGQSARLDEQRYRLVLESTRDVIWEWDVPGDRARYAGPLRELLAWPEGGEEPSFSEIRRRIHPDDRDRYVAAQREHFEKGLPYAETFRVERCDGTWIWLEARGQAICDAQGMPWRVIGSLRDVTEGRRLQEQLLQAQKMESIGRLAGGIAHDFNNLLTTIMGYTEMVSARLPESSRERAELDVVRKASQRAAELTRQMLGFARKQMTQPRVLSLNDVIRGMERMMALSEEIETRIVLAKDLWRVSIDPNQFEQVLMNLVVNARDAMPSGGRLTIETANCLLDETYVRTRRDVRPGEYVVVTVTDTGVGIARELHEKIFEPFFTTKEVGKGTGLGLATCFGIMQQNGGHMAVYSEPGHGAAFKVYLPRCEEGSAPVPAAAVEAPPGGHERILLVEDEPAVREIALLQLRKLGYDVQVAQDGLEALSLAMMQENRLDLVLTDMVMPRMGGRELAENLRQARPDIRVLFMSGYTENGVFQGGAGGLFLQKPFSLGELARKVRAALDARRP